MAERQCYNPSKYGVQIESPCVLAPILQDIVNKLRPHTVCPLTVDFKLTCISCKQCLRKPMCYVRTRAETVLKEVMP